nr:uncharacterized protein LOC129263309 [Lytechinus pictus]
MDKSSTSPEPSDNAPIRTAPISDSPNHQRSQRSHQAPVKPIKTIDISIATLNVRGFNTSKAYIQKILLDLDILAIQEHWLCSPLPLHGTSHSHLHIFKASEDRIDAFFSHRTRGKGGVAIFIRKSVVSTCKEIPTTLPRILAVLCKLSSACKPIVLINCYFPCGSSLVAQNELHTCLVAISQILASTKDATPILLGDFNNDIIGKPNKKTCNILRNFLHQESLCSLTSLHCSSSQYTFASDDGRHKSNIDGFYVHTYESSEFRGIDISDDDLNTSDHCLVSTTMSCLIQPNRESRDSMTCPTASLQAQRFKVKWNEATSEEIEKHYTIPMEKTAAALFQSFDSNLSLEANKADHLLLQLSQAMCQYSSDLPHSIAMKKKQGKPGWSTKTQEAHNEALAAWKAWKSQSNSKEGTLHDERIFAKKNFRKIYRQSIAIAEKNKITQTERASKSNQKLFYQLIKKNKGDRQQAETRSITYKNQRYEGDSLISGWQLYFKDLASGPVNTQDLVTEQLHIDSPVNNIQQGCSMAIASTCMDPEPTKPRYHGVSSMHLPSSPHLDCSPHLTLSFEDLTAAIHQLQSGRAAGMDNISSEHIKHLGPVAVRLLLLAYNAFLRHSHWPENLKQGLILPFHKGKGKDTEDPKNYRGITLTSTLGKLLELCVKPALDRQLQIANTPDELQFGFRKGFSCMLTSLCLELILELNTASRLPTYTAYLDAEKAFDCVA